MCNSEEMKVTISLTGVTQRSFIELISQKALYWRFLNNFNAFSTNLLESSSKVEYPNLPPDKRLLLKGTGIDTFKQI